MEVSEIRASYLSRTRRRISWRRTCTPTERDSSAEDTIQVRCRDGGGERGGHLDRLRLKNRRNVGREELRRHLGRHRQARLRQLADRPDGHLREDRFERAEHGR